MTHIANFVNDFNRNYSVKLNEYYGKEKNFTYTYGMINSIFDDLIADLTEGNNVSEFFKTRNKHPVLHSYHTTVTIRSRQL